MKEIILTSGHATVVSDEDYDYLNQWSWSFRGKGYVGRTVGDTGVYMHALVVQRMGLVSSTEQPDHKDRNKLNNQRTNFRLLTRSKNLHNSEVSKRSTTGVKGVTFDKGKGVWLVRIGIEGKRHQIGYFKDFDVAVKARQEAEKKFGVTISQE